jgi:hypothetical protein
MPDAALCVRVAALLQLLISGDTVEIDLKAPRQHSAANWLAGAGPLAGHQWPRAGQARQGAGRAAGGHWNGGRAPCQHVPGPCGLSSSAEHKPDPTCPPPTERLIGPMRTQQRDKRRLGAQTDAEP